MNHPDPRFSEPENSRLALITGASSGLGAEYANQLAAMGYDLILVARRKDRMDALASMLNTKFGSHVAAVSADLSLPDEQLRLQELIGSLPALDLLVNNAGFGTLGKFNNVKLNRHLEMVNLHIQTTISLTYATLPGMLARRSGAVINVASVAAFFPLPGGSIYCATKAALVSFTQTLALELSGTGVKLQVLCPGYTYTEFHDTSDYTGFSRTMLPRFLWGPAAPVVTQSLQALKKNQVVVIPRWINRLLSTFGRNQVFDPFVRPVIRFLFSK